VRFDDEVRAHVFMSHSTVHFPRHDAVVPGFVGTLGNPVSQQVARYHVDEVWHANASKNDAIMQSDPPEEALEAERRRLQDLLDEFTLEAEATAGAVDSLRDR
jgi:hypothetical protein